LDDHTVAFASENKVSIRKGDVAMIPNSKDFFIATAEVS